MDGVVVVGVVVDAVAVVVLDDDDGRVHRVDDLVVLTVRVVSVAAAVVVVVVSHDYRHRVCDRVSECRCEGVSADDVDVDINYQPTNGCHKKNYSFG